MMSDRSQHYPRTRMRRVRQYDWSRRLVRESHLGVDDLIWPLFVIDGDNAREDIPSMPGVNRLSVDLIVEAAAKAYDVQIPCIALFPYVDGKKKSDIAQEAYNSENLICKAVRAIREAEINIGIMTDVALDCYTSHGHDGLLNERGYVMNDETIEVLIKQSLVQAEAGCNIIAPSDMMDGRVGCIRDALDQAGYQDVMIMSYAAKYASATYGPFRDAVGSRTLLTGNKKTYQMDPSNTDEALREVALDINEGADMIMVKPGMFYLDVLSKIKKTFMAPTFCYQVSGEYAMIRAAFEREWIDGHAVMVESLLSMKRAGADAILTYAAYDVAKTIHKVM